MTRLKDLNKRFFVSPKSSSALHNGVLCARRRNSRIRGSQPYRCLEGNQRGYQAKAKHTVKFNFGPSNGLARQIEEGAPADIFFSADLAQMDTLDKNGRLEPGTRKNLLSNQLVIIVPADSKLAISSPKDLLKADIKKIALAEPSSVPVGVYSSKYLNATKACGTRSNRRSFRYKTFARPWLRSSPATSKPASSTKPTPPFPRK